MVMLHWSWYIRVVPHTFSLNPWRISNKTSLSLSNQQHQIKTIENLKFDFYEKDGSFTKIQHDSFSLSNLWASRIFFFSVSSFFLLGIYHLGCFKNWKKNLQFSKLFWFFFSFIEIREIYLCFRYLGSSYISWELIIQCSVWLLGKMKEDGGTLDRI